MTQPMPRPDAASTPAPTLPEGADFVDRVFEYLLAEFPQIAGPQFAQARRAVRAELAGVRVYVAARGMAEQREMAREVLSLFNGRNASEVARSLSISRATVYRVLKQSGRSDS